MQFSASIVWRVSLYIRNVASGLSLSHAMKLTVSSHLCIFPSKVPLLSVDHDWHLRKLPVFHVWHLRKLLVLQHQSIERSKRSAEVFSKDTFHSIPFFPWKLWLRWRQLLIIMSKFTTESVDLPACWASYLINGDASSFSLNDDGGEEEIALIDKIIEDLGWGDPTHTSEESGFMKYHDAHNYGVLASDCLTYYFLVPSSASWHKLITTWSTQVCSKLMNNWTGKGKMSISSHHWVTF